MDSRKNDENLKPLKMSSGQLNGKSSISDESQGHFCHYRTESYVKALHKTTGVTMEEPPSSTRAFLSPDEGILKSRSAPTTPKSTRMIKIELDNRSSTLPHSELLCPKDKGSSPRKSPSASIANFFKRLSPKLRRAKKSEKAAWMVVEFKDRDLMDSSDTLDELPSDVVRRAEEVRNATAASSPRKMPQLVSPYAVQGTGYSPSQVRKMDGSPDLRTSPAIKRADSLGAGTVVQVAQVTLDSESNGLANDGQGRKTQPPSSLDIPCISRTYNSTRSVQMTSTESLGACSLVKSRTDLQEDSNLNGSKSLDHLTSSTNYHSNLSINGNLESLPEVEAKKPSYINISRSVSGYTAYGRYQSKLRTAPPSLMPLSGQSSDLHSTMDNSHNTGNGECVSIDSSSLETQGVPQKSFVQRRIEQLCSYHQTTGTVTVQQSSSSKDSTISSQLESNNILPDNSKNAAASDHIQEPTLQESVQSKHIKPALLPKPTNIPSVRKPISSLCMKENITDSKSLPLGFPSTSPAFVIPELRLITKSDNAKNEYNQQKTVQVEVGNEEVVVDSRQSALSSLGHSASPTRDGNYFLNLVTAEEQKIAELCELAELEMQDSNVPEEACGKIRAAIGKSNLLLTKKFKQFKGLCQQNLTQEASDPFLTTCSDLAGFWDMVLLQVEEIHCMFKEIDKQRQNNWQEIKKLPAKEVGKKKAISSGSKTSGSSSPASKSQPKSAKALEATKAREEARRRLMEAKREGRRRNLSQSSDSVEIFAPSQPNNE